jgi:tetratricopeptide (TPR) repeat protein
METSLNRSESAAVAPKDLSVVGNNNSFLSRKNLLYLALLAIATAALYFPVRTHPFFNPDDAVYVTENNHVKSGLTPETLVWAFRSHYINWHPLTWISHAADFQLFGLDPAGHHLMNVFFHVLNALLLYWVLQRATGYMGRSFMVAALFALHPINVESVAWIAERKTLLSTTFFLLALGAYRWYVERPREGRYWVVAGLFAAALLAKPQVIAFPFLLLLWDYWPLKRFFLSNGPQNVFARIPWREVFPLVKEKLTLFFFAAADALMTLNAQGVTSHDYRTYSLLVRLNNAIVSYVRYIGKAFWPIHLAPCYPHPGQTLPVWQVIASLAILIAITLFVIRNLDEQYLAVGWFWFLGCMVPMIGIVQVGDQAMADRYAYQPFIGLFIMFCWGITAAWKKLSLPALALPVCGAVPLLCAVLVTHRQIDYWQDDRTLWSHALSVVGETSIVDYHLGEFAAATGNESDAIAYFRKAFALAPQEAYVNLQLGWYQYKHHNFAAALPYYENALKAPGYQPLAVKAAYKGMALAYRGLGDSENASKYEELEKKVNIPPETQ